MNNIDVKLCSKCKKYIDKKYFHKDPSKKDGLYSSCKFCNNKKEIWKYEERFKDEKKLCTKCLNYLTIDNFVKDKSTKDGYSPNCKDCRKKSINRDLEKKTKKIYYEKNKNIIAEKTKLYNQTTNAIRKRRERDKNRRKNPLVRIEETISRQINNALNGEKSGKRWKEFVNYNEKELKEHLENQFEDWMNWGNYGKLANYKIKTWHIDHIKPITSFNFNNINSVKECWALENLRPLEKIENIKKGNCYEQ